MQNLFKIDNEYVLFHRVSTNFKVLQTSSVFIADLEHIAFSCFSLSDRLKFHFIIKQF